MLALVGLTRHRPALRPHGGVVAKVAVALAAGIAVALVGPASRSSSRSWPVRSTPAALALRAVPPRRSREAAPLASARQARSSARTSRQ